jgi:protein-S-isoprenylcysteine O-methyltransferase Ste14
MKSKARALLGSFVFLLLAPGVTAGLVPWWLTRWEVNAAIPYGLAPRALGAGVAVLAAGVLLVSFLRFALEGIGTPAPVAPTRKLVIGGPYRYVRNPMYLAVATIIAGEAVFFGQLSLLAWLAVFLVAVVSFVRFYEEPTLRRQFGEEYERYRREVPGWWPRLRAWRPA